LEKKGSRFQTELEWHSMTLLLTLSNATAARPGLRRA
jgi:hypothetical protein